MKNKKQFDAKNIAIALLILGVIVLGMYSHNLQKQIPETNQRVQVTDRVSVSNEIIEGYEGCDYIPRSASINKEMRGIEE